MIGQLSNFWEWQNIFSVLFTVLDFVCQAPSGHGGHHSGIGILVWIGETCRLNQIVPLGLLVQLNEGNVVGHFTARWTVRWMRDDTVDTEHPGP